MNETASLIVHLPKEDLGRLESLAESTKQSISALAAAVLAEYLAVHQQQIAAVQEGLAAAERGDVIPHGEVAAWLESWGTEHELPRPRAKQHR